MKKILTMVIASVTLGIVSYADSVQFRYTMKVNDTALTDSMIVFGRDNDATDGIDMDFDFPSIPNIENASANPAAVPLPGPVQDIYFRAQVSIAGEGESVDNAYDKLYRDIRDASKNATTWTLCTYSNDVELSWEGKYYDETQKVTINSALAENAGELKLYDSSNKELVADMRTTTSYKLKANSVYNIKYIGPDATSAAPETPEEFKDEFVVVSGASTEFDIIDVTKYTLVDWTLCFYYVAGKDDAGDVLKKFANKDIKMSDNNPNATYNPETGKFIYTYTNDFDHDLAEFRLLYSYKYANPTRSGDDNAGVATGMLRSVVADVIIKLDDDSKEVEINAKGTDEEKKATINFTVTTGEKLTLYGEFTLPEWNDKKIGYDPWKVSFKVDGEDVKGVITDGNPSVISFTAAKPLVKLEEAPTAPKDIVVSVELTGNENCKSGDVVFAPKYVSYDDTEKPADTLTANVKVKGVANLDIDGSGKFDLIDVRLLRNYAFGGSATTARGDTTMLSGLSTETYDSLPGADKSEKAAGVRAAIAGMVDSLDVDGSGTYDLVDVRLFRNYAFGGSAATARGDTTMLSGLSTEAYDRLPGADKSEKAAGVRKAIADMIE